ncbi:hypothetical protein ACSEE7_20090 [Halomonas cupida]|uniref:hypothetical protein n=1 Tax=Halomonas cupida TaxID=44933 RepID=UPI003EFAC75B
MSERNTRQARQLVRRLARDCNFEWPGGEENAALLYDRSTRRWELRCIDSTPAPVIRGPTPLTHLLRDGFVLIRWPDDQIELYHVETAHSQLRHRLEEAEVAQAGA